MKNLMRSPYILWVLFFAVFAIGVGLGHTIGYSVGSNAERAAALDAKAARILHIGRQPPKFAWGDGTKPHIRRLGAKIAMIHKDGTEDGEALIEQNYVRQDGTWGQVWLTMPKRDYDDLFGPGADDE